MTDTDAVFETLAARRRRYVLYHLLEADGAVALQALAGLIAAAESGQPVVSIAAERRQRIAIELDHTHLPLLEAQGFIDRENEFVELATGFERVSPYLELASRYEPPPTVARGDA
jgi:hypothetical protein